MGRDCSQYYCLTCVYHRGLIYHTEAYTFLKKKSIIKLLPPHQQSHPTSFDRLVWELEHSETY